VQGKDSEALKDFFFSSFFQEKVKFQSSILSVSED